MHAIKQLHCWCSAARCFPGEVLIRWSTSAIPAATQDHCLAIPLSSKLHTIWDCTGVLLTPQKMEAYKTHTQDNVQLLFVPHAVTMEACIWDAESVAVYCHAAFRLGEAWKTEFRSLRVCVGKVVSNQLITSLKEKFSQLLAMRIGLNSNLLSFSVLANIDFAPYEALQATRLPSLIEKSKTCLPIFIVKQVLLSILFSTIRYIHRQWQGHWLISYDSTTRRHFNQSHL